MSYLGSFKVPAGNGWMNGGWTLAFNPARGSLLASGHPIEWQVSEFTIPGYGGQATAIQAFSDPLEGKRTSVDGDKGSGVFLGGLLPSGNRLLVTAYAYYDSGASQQTKPLFATALDQSVKGDVSGPVGFGSAGAGMVSGYLMPIPTEWQAALGGTAAAGQCCIPITRRTSSGPSLSVFTPPAGAVLSTVTATQLLGYPLTDGQPTLPSSTFHLATFIPGGVIPTGFRSVLFIGKYGTSSLCYGTGPECHDPTDENKGYHAYPYITRVWAYDLNDLAAVKAGKKKPADLRPYAMWPITLPGVSADPHSIHGVAIDQTTNRIFVSAVGGDSDNRPLIYVLQLK